MSSILQKLAECSKALRAWLGVKYVRISPTEVFAQFLEYTTFSTEPATHVAVMSKVHKNRTNNRIFIDY